MARLRRSGHRQNDRDETSPGKGDPTRKRQAAQAYQGAFEAVFAILIGAGLGYLVDDRFGTSPLYLFVGIAIGFGAFVLRLVRLGRALQPSDGEPSQPSQDDGSTGRE
jgi:F0F1-type ATP synthase assembly protein I